MEKDEDGAFKVKIILIGDSGVGKTNLINISTGKQFNEGQISTTSCCFCVKRIELNNKRFNLYLWDTIGQEKLKSLTRIFFKNSKIVILVFDITHKDTFEGLNYWLKEVKDNLPDDTIIGVCGNKADLYMEEQVSKEECEEYAKSINAKMAYTSAKDDKVGFNNFLIKLVQDYYNANKKVDTKEINSKKENNHNIVLNNNNNQKNKEKNNSNCCK